MTALLIAIGVLLGAAGGLGHLMVTRWRTRLALTRGAGSALLSYPLALAAPALAVILAAQVSPLCAWVSPLGLLCTHGLFFVMGRR